MRAALTGADVETATAGLLHQQVPSQALYSEALKRHAYISTQALCKTCQLLSVMHSIANCRLTIQKQTTKVGRRELFR